MATASASTKKMPLPVEIFCGAMERQLPLADYARDIDLHPDILRQALAGRLQGADTDPLNALAKAIDCDPQQLDLTILPSDESFGMWLKRNMEGITQHALRARAQLDGQTLKGFLNGDLLPDSDQAERISRALYIDRMEIARVVTANMAAAAPSTASQESAELSAVGRQSNVSTASRASTGTRRRRASSRQASAEPALSAAAPTTLDETAVATLEPDTAATEASPMAGKRPRRASKPAAQLPAPIVAAMAAHQPHDASSSSAAVEAQEADRNGGSVTEKEAGTRRSKRPPSRSLATVAAAEQTPAPAETKMAADHSRAREFAAEDASPKRASSGRRPRAIRAAATDISSSGEVPSASAAEIAPSKPDQRSGEIGMDRTAPLVPAELAVDTATLQLSADEVRLIRHWRLLHPHGRRATLQYIGSLLVDD